MTKDTLLNEARRLHEMGAAVIWLHPKSKRPVANGWTTGPRATWDELRKSYVKGYNVGVRLGEASKIGKNYLWCFDVDIKDAAFKPKALAKLKEILGGVKCPTVWSGAGNGSMHLYGVGPTPFKMITILKEKGLGEICAYSTGRQMVLAPSIHPDTGKPYKWADAPMRAEDLPALDVPAIVNITTPEAAPTSTKAKADNILSEADKRAGEKFEVVAVEIDWLPGLSDKMRAMIKTGEGVADRSAMLMPACVALLHAGLVRNEILSVLVDKKNYLGLCAYEHAKTNDPVKAARWVWNYTLKKVMSEQSAAALFSEPIKEPKELNFDEAGEGIDEKGALSLEAKENGFYEHGPRGAMIPLYGELLAYFNEQKPFKTIADMKGVFTYNGTHYEYVSPIQIKAFAEDNFRPHPSEKVRLEFLHKVFANKVTTRLFFTETTGSKLNFKNGVLDLSNALGNQELAPHSPEYGFRGVLPYDYDPAATCPTFLKWLKETMQNDAALMCIVQEFMGYVVRGGEYKYHKALWLDGSGRNGKSTFIDLLKSLIGADNYSTTSIRALTADRFASSELDGKIANFCEETSPEELKDSGPFKNLTGNGDISAQKKFGDPFHFRNRAKLIMTYNKIPDLKDLSPGMLSRPLIIPFRRELEDQDQDRNMHTKLVAELSGIFNFALRGWVRLEKQNGFTQSTASASALTSVKDESCNAFQWFTNYVDLTETHDAEGNELDVLFASDIYEAYVRKEKYAYRMSDFFKRLNRIKDFEKRHERDNKRVRYLGVKIR